MRMSAFASSKHAPTTAPLARTAFAKPTCGSCSSLRVAGARARRKGGDVSGLGRGRAGGAPVEHDGEDDPACARAGDDDADRERAARAEVVPYDGERGQEGEPEPEAHAHRLCEEDLGR